MKQQFLNKTTFVKNGCSLSNEQFPGLKLSLEGIHARQNLFLKACFCWDSRLSLREEDQNFKIGGTIGYGDSYLEYTFCRSKVFRLHAILHNAAGAVQAHNSKGPGYCYMIGRGTNSCLLGHMTGLLFCLYLKGFPPSIYNSVHFCSSMFGIVLDFEIAVKNVIKDLGVFHGNF